MVTRILHWKCDHFAIELIGPFPYEGRPMMYLPTPHTSPFRHSKYWYWHPRHDANFPYPVCCRVSVITVVPLLCCHCDDAIPRILGVLPLPWCHSLTFSWCQSSDSWWLSYPPPQSLADCHTMPYCAVLSSSTLPRQCRTLLLRSSEAGCVTLLLGRDYFAKILVSSISVDCHNVLLRGLYCQSIILSL